jgi:hypothetical protein
MFVLLEGFCKEIFNLFFCVCYLKLDLILFIIDVVSVGIIVISISAARNVGVVSRCRCGCILVVSSRSWAAFSSSLILCRFYGTMHFNLCKLMKLDF